MVSAYTLRFALAALFLAGTIAPARALQLGESQAQTIARHGAPEAEDRRKDGATYSWDGWSAELEYKKGAVHKLIYRRNTYLADAEVMALLGSNGGLERWRDRTPDGEPTRRWVRDDGAVASCLAVRPLMMTFQGGETLAAAAAAKPTVVVTAPAKSTLPAFPKLLGSMPELASEPAPFSTNPLPKLQAEEVGEVVTPRSETSPPVVEPPDAPLEIAAPVVIETGTLPPPPTHQHKVPEAGEGGATLGWFVAFATAVSGGIFYLHSRRSRPVAPQKVRPAMPATRRVEGKVTSAATPAFDALRRDQCDLLVGEIFRRAGYTVELSAAAAQDDGIDLTLRRDGETILVQCKHWNTPRVSEREVREFYGAMMANGAPRGVFVTTGGFARDAIEFAEGKQIELMDRAALEESTAAVARPGENFCAISEWIGEFSTHSRIFDPECPICQGSMVIRHNRANGAASWSCRNHPRCPGRREPRLDLLAVAAAH